MIGILTAFAVGWGAALAFTIWLRMTTRLEVSGGFGESDGGGTARSGTHASTPAPPRWLRGIAFGRCLITAAIIAGPALHTSWLVVPSLLGFVLGRDRVLAREVSA